MNKPRAAVSALALSAAGLIALVSHEGYREKAYVPVPGDRPTVGFGSTFNPDGTPVKLGDTVTPQKALRMTLAHVGKDEMQLKRCVTGTLSQQEYDILVDFAYNYGSVAACKSSMVRHINAGNYTAACQAYGHYRFAAGRDCSDPASRCRGVWLRSQERVTKCMEAQ